MNPSTRTRIRERQVNIGAISDVHAGIPVFNVAYPVMKASGERCRIWRAPVDQAVQARATHGGER